MLPVILQLPLKFAHTVVHPAQDVAFGWPPTEIPEFADEQ